MESFFLRCGSRQKTITNADEQNFHSSVPPSRQQLSIQVPAIYNEHKNAPDIPPALSLPSAESTATLSRESSETEPNLVPSLRIETSESSNSTPDMTPPPSPEIASIPSLGLFREDSAPKSTETTPPSSPEMSSLPARMAAIPHFSLHVESASTSSSDATSPTSPQPEVSLLLSATGRVSKLGLVSEGSATIQRQSKLSEDKKNDAKNNRYNAIKRFFLEDLLSFYPLGSLNTCAGKFKLVCLRALQVGGSLVAAYPVWNTLNTYYYEKGNHERNSLVDALFISVTAICFFMAQKGTGKGLEIAKNFGAKVASIDDKVTSLQERISDLEARKEADIHILRMQRQMILEIEKRVENVKLLVESPSKEIKQGLFARKAAANRLLFNRMRYLHDMSHFYRKRSTQQPIKKEDAEVNLRPQ